MERRKTRKDTKGGRGHWPVADLAVDFCHACGAPLEPRTPGKAGAPAMYCKPETGRACREWSKHLSKLLSLSYAIADNAPAEHHRRILLKLGGQIQASAADVRYAEG